LKHLSLHWVNRAITLVKQTRRWSNLFLNA
jgi:hypothetical protein